MRHYRSTGGASLRATFAFVCRCFGLGQEADTLVADFLEDYRRQHGSPDLVLILSALWDINWWGARWARWSGRQVGQVVSGLVVRQPGVWCGDGA